MKYRIIYLLVFLFCSTIWGQNCNIAFSGKVEDFHKIEFLQDAVILIKELNRYTTTDKKGLFKLKNLCKGNFTIEISHISCDTKKIKISLTKDAYKNIFLEHHVEFLEEVKVKLLNTNSSTKQVNTIKKNVIDSYTSGNLGDVLKEVSGISSINTGHAIVKPIINGLHSSRISVLVNDVRLQDQDWGVEHAPSVDLSSASNITIYKGANALEFSGDAIGGVVLIKPNKIIRKDTLFGQTFFSLQSNARAYSVSTSLEKYTKKGWYVNGTASYKKFGDASTPDYNLTNTGVNSSAFTINTGLKKFEYGFEAFYSYLDNEIGILSASHLGNRSDLVDAINASKPLIINNFSYTINSPKQAVTHQIAKLLGYKRFKNLGKLQFQYNYQNNHRLEFDKRVGSDKFKAATDLTLQTHTLKANFKFDANTEKIYKVGISAQYQNNFANPDTGVRRIIPDYDKYDIGIFGISTYKFENFVLDAGLRYDYTHYDAKKFYQKSRWIASGYNTNFSQFITREIGSQYLTNPKFTYHNISFSAGINYLLNDYSSLLFNYGLSNRSPNPSELFSDGLHHSAARIETGDLNLDKETSNRFGTTYKYSKNKWNLNLDGYVNFIKDFIFVAPNGIETTIRGDFPVFAYQKTDAVLYGLDGALVYTISKQFNFQNKSSFIIGTDVKNNTSLIDIPPFQISNTVNYSNKEFYNFYASIESIFMGKQTNFPDFNFTTTLPSGQSVLVDVSTPPNAYHLVNFKSGARFSLNNTSFQVNLSVNNLLNNRYRDYLNRLRYFADELGRNFKLQLIIKY
jgi:iron complex outermembrane receptor protein